MAGIVSIFDRTGGVRTECVTRMLEPMNYRGKDGSGFVQFPRAGLGHQHLYTTPEERGESQPISSDDVYITFDGRIDNRRELLESPDIRGRTTGRPSDAALALYAYLERGVDFVSDVVGAFSFALWDPAESRFFCARDPTGIRSLYYTTVGDKTIVGSEISSIIAHPDVSPTVNEAFLAEFLIGDIRSREQTFYDGIRRLDHGSSLLIEDGETDVRRYWQVNDEPKYRDLSETELVEKLQEILRTAISSRMRSVDSSAFAMSGGLDSTTLVAVSNQDVRTDSSSPLQLFSLIFESIDEPVLKKERERIELMGERDGVTLQTIRGDEYWPLKNWQTYRAALSDGPVSNSLLCSNEVVYRKAADSGFRSIVHGGGGNNFDGNRFSYLDTLLSLRPTQFVRDVTADPMATRYLLKWYVLAPLLPELSKRVLKYRWGEDVDELPEWMPDEFVEKTDLNDRVSVDRLSSGLNRKAMAFTHDLFFRPSEQFLLDDERQLALDAGVELRYPYRDARLVEFVFSLPTGYRITEGQAKYLFRKSAEEYIPQRILDQSESASFDPLVDRGLKEKEAERINRLFSDPTLEKLGMIDEDELNAIWDSYRVGDDRYSNKLWRFVSAEMWLETLEERGHV